MHLLDHNHQHHQHHHHHCLCDTSSIAAETLRCLTEGEDRDVASQMTTCQEKISKHASCVSLLPSLPLQCSSLDLESENSISSDILSLHICRESSGLYPIHVRIKIPVADMLLSLLLGCVLKLANTIHMRLAFTFVLLLFMSSLSNGYELHNAQLRDKSQSNSPFQSGISSELKFDLQESTEITPDVISRFEFPEFVALTGRLFWYQIPDKAFPNLERISHYKVSLILPLFYACLSMLTCACLSM